MKENFLNVITPACFTASGSEIGRKNFQRLVTSIVLLSVLAWSTACHKPESHSANANGASVNAVALQT
jgi:hypothetical protein